MSTPPPPFARPGEKRLGTRIAGGLAAVRRLVVRREVPCDHLHDSTTRYDRAAKRLDFLLVCPVCETEKLIHSLRYEPRFDPTGAPLLTVGPRDDVEAERPAA